MMSRLLTSMPDTTDELHYWALSVHLFIVVSMRSSCVKSSVVHCLGRTLQWLDTLAILPKCLNLRTEVNGPKYRTVPALRPKSLSIKVCPNTLALVSKWAIY